MIWTLSCKRETWYKYHTYQLRTYHDGDDGDPADNVINNIDGDVITINDINDVIDFDVISDVNDIDDDDADDDDADDDADDDDDDNVDYGGAPPFLASVGPSATWLLRVGLLTMTRGLRNTKFRKRWLWDFFVAIC